MNLIESNDRPNHSRLLGPVRSPGSQFSGEQWQRQRAQWKGTRLSTTDVRSGSPPHCIGRSEKDRELPCWTSAEAPPWAPLPIGCSCHGTPIQWRGYLTSYLTAHLHGLYSPIALRWHIHVHTIVSLARAALRWHTDTPLCVSGDCVTKVGSVCRAHQCCLSSTSE